VAAPANNGSQEVVQVSPVGQGQERREFRTAADLLQEYVAAGKFGYLSAGYVRPSERFIDDLTRDLSHDIYQQMMHDPQVASTVNLLVMAVLSKPAELGTGRESDDPDYQQAEAIADFCRWNLANLDRPFPELLDEMVRGMLVNGHKLAEQIYKVYAITPEAGPQIVLSDIKPKPNTAVNFAVDAYNNVVGILYAKPGQPLSQVAFVPQGNGADQQIIPADKFFTLTFRPEDSDPRGHSLLRGAYYPWYVKGQTYGELLAFLARFGSASVWGELSENAQDVTMDATGQLLDTPIPATTFLNSVLQDLKNGAVVTVPAGTKINLLQALGEGTAFFKALALCDIQITKNNTGQSLATEEGEHQSRAAAQVHQDVLGLLTTFLKNIVAASIQRFILKPLILYNFGEQALAFMPSVSLSEVEQQDFAAQANAIANLQRAGYLDPSQYQDIDNMLNLPERVVQEQPPPGQVPSQDQQQPPPQEQQPPDQQNDGGTGGQQQ
jgi:hypothetical protein